MTLPTCKTFRKAYSFLLDEGTCGFAVECSVKTVLTSLQRESSSFGAELLSCPETGIGRREYSREQRKNNCKNQYSEQRKSFLDVTEGDESNIKHKNTATCNTRNQQCSPRPPNEARWSCSKKENPILKKINQNISDAGCLS